MQTRGRGHRSCVAVGEEEASAAPRGPDGRDRRRAAGGGAGQGGAGAAGKSERRGLGGGERDGARRPRSSRSGGQRSGNMASVGNGTEESGGGEEVTAGSTRALATRRRGQRRPGLPARIQLTPRRGRRVPQPARPGRRRGEGEPGVEESCGAGGPFPCRTASGRRPAPFLSSFFFSPPFFPPSLFNSAPSRRPAPRNIACPATAGRGGRAGRCPGLRRRERPSRKMRCCPVGPAWRAGRGAARAAQGRAGVGCSPLRLAGTLPLLPDAK